MTSGIEPVPATFSREVSAGPAHFVRDLRQAWPSAMVSDDGLTVSLEQEALRLHIELEPISPRQIGALCLPRLIARYRFEGADAPARARMLTRLDLAMQRGGG